MSIFKINPTDYQSVTIATRPSRTYSSSSISGVTGSIFVYPRRSPIEKEITPANEKEEGWFNDANIEVEFQNILSTYNSVPDVSSVFESYLNSVNAAGFSNKKAKSLDIDRFTPSPYTQTKNGVEDLTNNLYKKLTIRESLSPYYKNAYRNLHWGYTNYNSLNFFSASSGNDSPAIIYPNLRSTDGVTGYANGVYLPNDKFSFDFHINPRYNYLDQDGHFRAGTIFHLSSSYALSLVTGSLKDHNGLPLGFNLVLQLSHSADIPPSRAVPGPYPNDLIFVSKDNILTHNNWHRVVVRWGTNLVNQGTGSFIVDGIESGTFDLYSGTIAPKEFADNATDPANPDALFVGNYYEGNNSGNDRLKKFFSQAATDFFGVSKLDNDVSLVQPNNFSCTHPLRAELHHLAIRKSYMSDLDIAKPNLGKTADTVFYLPPYFKEDVSIRYADYNNPPTVPQAGVPHTVSINNSGTTAEPFNIFLAFGTDGHYINIENYLTDFTKNDKNNLPRLINLSHTPVTPQTLGLYTANDHLYSQPEVRARNLLILPCDDGKYIPGFDELQNESIKNLYVDDDGNPEIYQVNLSKMLIGDNSWNYLLSQYEYKDNELEQLTGLSTVSIYNYDFLYKNFINWLTVQAIPSETKEYVIEFQRRAPLYVAERTKDVSSNQVTFFNISNLFYGMKISPNSFTITDSAISGSEGRINVTIKDDGMGGLYRANSLTDPCKWNSVGTIFYDEGIIAIKNPHLYFFGKEQFEISFKGEQNIHVMRLDVIAPANQLISSSNPSFRNVPSTNNPNERDSKFVYITGINFHDDNLNVVMKTQLAQPIMKRHSDKIAFKVKYDW